MIRVQPACTQALYTTFQILSTQILKIDRCIFQLEQIYTTSLTSWRNRIRKTCLESVRTRLLYILLPSLKKPNIAALQTAADVQLAQFSTCVSTQAKRVSIESDDNVQLDGVLFTHTAVATKNRKTLVVFLGNCELWQESLDNLYWLFKNSGKDVLCCNYRGTGNSSGFPRSDSDFVTDGKNQVLSLIAKGVTPKHIVLYGKGFGGAVATLTTAGLDEEGTKVHLTNQGSFRSMLALARHTIPYFKEFFVGQLEAMRMAFDAESALTKVKGQVIVIHNDSNPQIPYPVSFNAAAREKGLKKVTFIQLDDQEFIRNHPEYIADSSLFSHNRPFSAVEEAVLAQALQSI